MIERRRLDERTPSTSPAERVILGVAWLVSVPTMAALIYVSNQLDPDLTPTILMALLGIGAVLSFLVATPATAILVYFAARYLRYSKVRATLVVRTDRVYYRPGDDVRVSVSIDTDQRLILESGRVRLRRSIRQGDYGDSDVLSEVSLPFPKEGRLLLPGESYESTVALSLPVDAMEDPKGEQESLGPKSIDCKLDVSLQTSPTADANVELMVLESHSHGPQRMLAKV